MPRMLLFVFTIVAISAFSAENAQAQHPKCGLEMIEKTVCDQETPPNCTKKCVAKPKKRVRPPVNRVVLPPIETTLSAPESTKPSVDNASQEPASAPPPVAPAPATDTPPQDTNCEPGKFVVMRKGKSECFTPDEIKEKLTALEARLAELKSAQEVVALAPQPTPAEIEIKKIQQQLDELGKAIGELPDVSAEAVKKVEELKTQVETYSENVNAVSKAQASQSSRMSNIDERIADLEAGSSFGVQFGANAGLHVLRPYERVLWNAGGELTLLPAVSQYWRFLIGAGFGSAGKNSFDQYLMFADAMLGAQPRLARDIHLAFGAITEQRFSSALDYSSYGAFLEPKFCPTNKKSLEAHHFCFGFRAAGEATIFANPDTGTRYVRPDLSLAATVVYAYLPGSWP